VTTSSFSRALQVLDEVQRPPQLEAFDEGRFSAAIDGGIAVRGEGPGDLARHFEDVRGLIRAVEAFTEKSMRMQLAQSTDDIPKPLRQVLNGTITAYVDDLGLLRSRILPTLGEAVTDRVLALAEAVLARHRRLRAIAEATGTKVGTAWLPVATKRSRDRSLPDDERAAWQKAVEDLAKLTGTEVPPEPVEDPGDPVANRFSMIELD
jgi:hypothetical protein